MSSTIKSHWFRRYPGLAFAILSCLIIAILLFLSVIILYTSYNLDLIGYKSFSLSEYKEARFPELTDRQLVNLGWAHQYDTSTLGYNNENPLTSYLFYDSNKKPGVSRIGVFGCSYTQGIESAPGLDFPSLLQEHFNLGEIDSVEVINFGVASYGVHQMFLLYHYLGRHYELDYIIINPFYWHADRDRSFVFANYFGPVHARFIPENDTLRLIEIPGESRKAAVEAYRKYWQPKVYRKYDTRPPSLLKPYLKDDYNPYYYNKNSKNYHEEIYSTYKMIFSSIASDVKALLILNNHENVDQLNEELEADNIYFIDDYLEYGPDHNEYSKEYCNALYKAPHAHFSPLANKLKADKLYRLFDHSSDDPLLVFKLSLTDSPTDVLSNIKPFFELKELYFDLAGIRLDGFYKKTSDDYIWSYSEKLDLNNSSYRHLLLVSSSLNDLSFIPLTKRLNQQKANISLLLNQRSPIPIAELSILNPYIHYLQNEHISGQPKLLNDSVILNKLTFDQGLHIGIDSKFPINEASLNLLDEQLAGPLEIRLVSTRHFDTYEIYTYDLYLTPDNFIVIRSEEDTYLDLQQMKQRKGNLDLIVSWKEGNRRYPFLKWQMDTIINKAERHPELKLNGI